MMIKVGFNSFPAKHIGAVADINQYLIHLITSLATGANYCGVTVSITPT
jgi:hypothetical protein